MVWFKQATSHCLIQYRLICLTIHRITGPQWVKCCQNHTCYTNCSVFLTAWCQWGSRPIVKSPQGGASVQHGALPMMTSSNGNIFRVTGQLCGEFTGEFPAQKPVTRSFDLHPNKRLSKQSWGWWFETPSCPLWCPCNALWELRPANDK